MSSRAADTHHRREGEEVAELQRRETGRPLGREDEQDQEILEGVHREGPPQAREVGQATETGLYCWFLLNAG